MNETDDIPCSWQPVMVSQLAEAIEYGYTASAVERRDSPRFLRITDIQNGRVDWSRVPSCDVTSDGVRQYGLRAGDIVFARTGATTGKSYLIRECPEAVFASYLIRLRFLDGVVPAYVQSFFQTNQYWRQIEAGKRGIGQPNVNAKVLGAIELPLAPLNEQHRIVDEIEKQFTRLDAGVAALKRVDANLRRYKAAVLKAAVEGRLTARWRAKHPDVEPASELLKRILTERRRRWEQSELAKMQAKGKPPTDDRWKKKYPEPKTPELLGPVGLPSTWCWATLSQLGLLDRGKSRHRPRDAEHLYDGPYPFIQTGDITDADGVIRSWTQTYSEAGLAQSRLWPAGTLCITIAANIAETAILGFDGCFPDSVVGFRGQDDEIDVRYVELYMRTAQADLERLAPATAQKNINLETLRRLAVPVPPLPEQREIVAEAERRLSFASEIASAGGRGLRRASRLRQSILKRAFEGKLVPQDPTDEPASVLLDRIRSERAKISSPGRYDRLKSREMSQKTSPERMLQKDH